MLDLRMPEMDGFAVLNELRSNPETAKIPVVVVTGDVDLNASEREQLANVRILPKTQITNEQYNQLLNDIRNELRTL
jgi:CheY-like chemotaxis protein